MSSDPFKTPPRRMTISNLPPPNELEQAVQGHRESLESLVRGLEDPFTSPGTRSRPHRRAVSHGQFILHSAFGPNRSRSRSNSNSNYWLRYSHPFEQAEPSSSGSDCADEDIFRLSPLSEQMGEAGLGSMSLNGEGPPEGTLILADLNTQSDTDEEEEFSDYQQFLELKSSDRILHSLRQNENPKPYHNHLAPPEYTGRVPAWVGSQGLPQWCINPHMGRWFSSNYPPVWAYQTKPYEKLTKNGFPDEHQLLKIYFPFADLSGRVEIQPKWRANILKITNIPYDVEKCEIVAALGRDATLLAHPPNSVYYGVHIMYDRHLGKTNEVYVECPSPSEARQIKRSLERYLERTGKGRVVRNRVVNVTFADSGELQALLFPKARCIQWNGTEPLVRLPLDNLESPFNGFLTDEELRNVVGFAKRPGVGLHGKDSPQRPFEDMISILQKYPWHRTDLYTLQERDMIFGHLVKMVEFLVKTIKDCVAGRGIYARKNFTGKINQRLLDQILQTACIYGNFTPRQQAQLVGMTNRKETVPPVNTRVNYPLYRLSPYWPFESLQPRHGCDDALLEYYIHLIYIGTTCSFVCSSAELKWTKQIKPDFLEDPFGGYSIQFSDHKHRSSFLMADLAEKEIKAVHDILRRVISTASTNPYFRSLVPQWCTEKFPQAGPFYVPRPLAIQDNIAQD